ncbi:dentin sialophosphoprotein-like [Oryzias latipes]|uniref:dentin sialophosphoprotein-like n=1 Tax=Oryzias latipes TaxID=8090 RepID=UPI000CE17E59|nr:dentin sialophosphoprotein-like [Oryzias latipes]
MSQTLSSLEVVKETDGAAEPPESKSVSEIDTNYRPKSKEADEYELVPSILPNASPTEVVNEWLKTIPPESDIYEMEDLSENSEKISQAAEGGNEVEDSKKTDNSSAETSKDIDTGGAIHPDLDDECKTGTETSNDNNGSPQTADASKILNSSVQVMRVLLNPKSDRCNSLPEISPVYGQNEQKPTRSDNRCVEDDYNHTSSSGVDVNSGSTGSGKSSDGIKSSNSNHEDASQPVCKDTKGDAVWHSEREEQKEEDNPETNDTIRNNDSPRETPETPSSSNKSSGTSSTISQKVIQEAELKGEEDLDPESHILSTRADLTKSMSHNPDPVWVINLLTKIEKQFMVHYVSAMKEFKGRWNLADNDQLDEIINELKAEIERRIQKSINREVKKIQDSVGLPRPPNDTVSQESTSQAKERKQKLKKRLQHSAGSQDEISGNSTTGTPYSDQRSDNTDESCPCETCIKKRKNSEASLRMEATNAAHSGNCRNSDEIKVAETLVENVVFAAVKEVEGEKVEQCTENTSSYEVDKKGDDCESMESLTKHEKQKKPVVAEWDSEDDVNETLGEEAKTVDETPLEGETEDFDEDESEEIKTKAVDDKDAIMEADAETAAEEESAKDENPEEELVKNEIRVINEPELLNELSVASTAEKEEGNTETAEVSMAATHENKSERDEVVEDFDEAEHESVKEAALEIGSVNDEEEDGGLEDFDEDSNSTTNDDDTSDDTTSHGLSSEAADDAKEDEVAVEKEFEMAREDEVCDVQTKVSAGEDETVKESDESATSEHGSVTRKNSEEGLQSDLEVVSPISEDDPPTQNQNLVSDNDLAKVPDDIATTEDDTSEEKHSTGDDESKEDTDAEEESSSEVRASSDHESESEEPVKMEKVNAEEESSAASESQSAEDLDGTSNAISGEDEPAEEAAAGRVSKHDSEKDEEEEESSVVKKEKPLETSADENRDTSTADESSSEEDAKMTNDDLATDKDQAATSQSESKDETDEDETGTEEADKDEETELHTQEDTADDVNDTGVISEDLSTEDETPKENVAMCRDPLNEQSEKDLPKTEEEPATPETNSDYPGVTSGAENDSKEGEPDQANNEDPTAIFKEPDQEEVTANRESEDENEEDHGETPVVDQADITSEDGEEDTTSKSSSEDESKEESKNSGTDESRPGSTVTDANDTTGQDESRVSNDSESPDDSEAEPKNQVVDEILQEASDENETPSRSEEQEKTKSSEKPADSNASELLTEDKSEEDKSYSEDVMEQEHKVPEEKSGDVITENETKDESGEEETGAGEETDVLTIITDEGQAFKEDTGRKDVQKSESKDFNSCEKEKNMDDALDKEEETETANDDWSGDEGNSADEEDEAEEDSDEPEEHTQAELKPLVISKATNQSQPDRQGKETLLMPLDTLKKEKDESEDGTYADIEDSETEINSQK